MTPRDAIITFNKLKRGECVDFSEFCKEGQAYAVDKSLSHAGETCQEGKFMYAWLRYWVLKDAAPQYAQLLRDNFTYWGEKR